MNPVISATNQIASWCWHTATHFGFRRELRSRPARSAILAHAQQLTNFDQSKDGFLHRLLHLHLRRRQGRRARQGCAPHRPVSNPLTSLPLHGTAREIARWTYADGRRVRRDGDGIGVDASIRNRAVHDPTPSTRHASSPRTVARHAGTARRLHRVSAVEDIADLTITFCFLPKPCRR